MGPKTTRLIAGTALRRWLDSAVSVLHVSLIILAAVSLLLLFLSRFFALIPSEYFDLRSQAWIPPLALAVLTVLVLSAILARRPTASQTARLVDTRMGTKDIFLTTARIDGAYGDFKPIVLSQAEEKAVGIRPSSVVRFHWLAKARNVGAALVVLVGMALLVPQYDLLGREAELQKQADRKKLLDETRKAAAKRTAVLKQSDPSARQSKEVETAVAELKQTFNQAKPKEADANFKRLNTDQRALAEKWRQISETKLKDALNQNPTAQQFGTKSLEKQTQWKQEMRSGDPSGLRKEIAELETMARKLDQLAPGTEKATLEQELKKRMEDLSDFLEKEMNSRPCAGALARGLDQLGLSDVKGLSAEALQALQESLSLTDLEIQQLAQSARDLQNLEEALKAIQMAKSLNKMLALDGAQCTACQGMEDYTKLYENLLKEMGGAGQGEGQEGEGSGPPNGPNKGGHGRGGKLGEDDTVESDFTPEQARSAMQAGKMLLEWKTKGMAESGKTGVNYEQQVENVKKGVSEAILREQIPPGYHDAIQKYFDQYFKENPNAAAPK